MKLLFDAFRTFDEFDTFEIYLKTGNFDYKKHSNIKVYNFAYNRGNNIYDIYEYQAKGKHVATCISEHMDETGDVLCEAIYFVFDDNEKLDIDKVSEAIRQHHREKDGR